MGEDPSLIEDGDEPVVALQRWTGPWPEDDPDANFKTDVAAYNLQDPLPTIRTVAGNLDIPIGSLVRYVLARWASGGTEGLLELGASAVDQMTATVHRAEQAGTDDARLAAYETLREQLSWLRIPLDDAGATPGGGG